MDWVKIGDVWHMKKCAEAFGRYYLALSQFEAKYPKYCHACGGTGIIEWNEVSDPYGSRPMSDPCDTCWLKCPRCGHEFSEDEYEIFQRENSKCPICDFILGANLMEVAPLRPDCMCWEHVIPFPLNEEI